jgi:hypothetical protein
LGTSKFTTWLELLDVDAARDDVGGDEDLELAALEAFERERSLRLRPVPMYARDGHATALQHFGESVRAVLRSREHDHVLEVAPPNQLEEQRRLEGLGTG